MTSNTDSNPQINRSYHPSQVRPALFDLARHGYLLKTLTLSDIRAPYSGSVLGGVWIVLKPLVLIGIYTIVFSSAARAVGSMKGEPVNFGLFIFAGMLPWLSVQESIQRGSTIMIDLAQLIRHHTFPLGLLPLHVVLSVTLSQLVAILAFVVVQVILTGHMTPLAPLILLAIPFQIVFCFAMALIVAIMNVFLRDIAHVTTSGLVVWFFSSPIVFPLESFPDFLQPVLWLNPMTGLTQIYRDLLLAGRIPSVLAVGSFLLITILVILAGTGLYRRTHQAVVDWI